MTQQNAAMVEQSNAAARSLADEASELAALVEAFETGRPQVAAVNTQRRAAPRLPVISGNLALKSDDGDWAEF